MVDNRAAGFYGIGGAFNFKSGDISGTAASLQEDKNGQGNEYYAQRKGGEESTTQMNSNPYVDRSAQLNATLSSLAMLNVANVLNTKMRAKDLNKIYNSEDDELEPSKEEQFVYRISAINKDRKNNTNWRIFV